MAASARLESAERWAYGVLAGWVLLVGVAGAVTAAAQESEAPEGMTVGRVDFLGLETISEGFVRRLVRTRPDQPLNRGQVADDVRALLQSRKFLAAFATTAVEEGKAVVRYNVREKPAVLAVELEGNKRFEDKELFELTPVPNTPLDAWEVNRGREDILQKYRQAGYYYATVTIDELALQSEGRVIYRITEGPRVRVRDIDFEGNRALGTRRLRALVQSQTYIWIFRAGALDEDQAERDTLALQQLYRDEGYLDARVGYRLDFDEIARADVRLIFVIEEGPRYTVQEIVVRGNEVFSTTRLREEMELLPGRPARNELVRRDTERLRDLYGGNGYIDARIQTTFDYLEEPGLVVLRYDIDEDEQYRFGRITIRGNLQTKDEVVRRELRFYPGQFYNTNEVRRATQRLRETGLFRPESIEIVPLEPIDDTREALVTIEETETTQFLVGFGVSTDSGLVGSISLDNRNFDLFAVPRTWGEFFRGRSFKGDGQRLLIQFEPGTEVTRFRISFTEPYLFDQRIRFDSSAYLFQRGRDGYDEQRLGLSLALSRRFDGGFLDGWAIEGSTRFELIDIMDVDVFAARQIREQCGDHTLATLKGAIVRDQTDSRLFPTEGYRLSFAWEQAGLLGGDFTFSKPSFSAAWYKTLQTDILDRKSVLAVRADVAYIFGDYPMFEAYYAGGFGSLRGFAYRGISPRNGVYKNAIGGNFIVLTGAEYSFPLYGQNLRGVTFVDMGTVEEGFGISAWRVAAGFGVRLQVDFFGPVPIVFDFGFPLIKQGDDNTQVFNFAFGASF